MIVEGRGLLAAGFLERGLEIDATLFARGVADSTCVDEAEYERESSMLREAVEAAAGRRHPLVYFSSAPVYGRFDGREVAETDPPRPTSTYGRHKLACEAIVRSSTGPSLVLRLPNVVGPGGHPNQLVPSLVRQVLAGRVMVLEGASRDVLDVDDLVVITTRLLDGGAPERLAATNRTLNVASGICTPVGELVHRIASILDRQPTLDTVQGGEAQRFSIVRLEGLIGELDLGSDYLENVLSRRVPEIAAMMAAVPVGAVVPAAR